MVTRVQPGCRILNSEQPNFYRLPKCVHQHSALFKTLLPPFCFCSVFFVSVFRLRLLCSISLRVVQLVALGGRLEERRVRPRCG